jgi:hypothetical protein
MKELVDKEITLFVGQFRIKGRAKLYEDESVLPVDSPGDYVEIAEATVFTEGASNVARTRFLHVRKTEIQMYFLEEYALPKVR